MNFNFRNGLIWISIDIEYEGENVKIDNCIVGYRFCDNCYRY